MGIGKGTGKGGYRENSPKPTWNKGRTTTVRVPQALKDDILELARALDEDKPVSINSSDSGSTLDQLKEVVKEYRDLLESKPTRGKSDKYKNTRTWENVDKLVSELESIIQNSHD